jgi:hypothetical protein
MAMTKGPVGICSAKDERRHCTKNIRRENINLQSRLSHRPDKRDKFTPNRKWKCCWALLSHEKRGCKYLAKQSDTRDATVVMLSHHKLNTSQANLKQNETKIKTGI